MFNILGLSGNITNITIRSVSSGEFRQLVSSGIRYPPVFCILWYSVSSGFSGSITNITIFARCPQANLYSRYPLVFGILWYSVSSGFLRRRIRRYNPVFFPAKMHQSMWPGLVGPVTSAAGPLGKGKVSGSVECCSPVAAGAAGSTRTWA